MNKARKYIVFFLLVGCVLYAVRSQGSLFKKHNDLPINDAGTVVDLQEKNTLHGKKSALGEAYAVDYTPKEFTVVASSDQRDQLHDDIAKLGVDVDKEQHAPSSSKAMVDVSLDGKNIYFNDQGLWPVLFDDALTTEKIVDRLIQGDRPEGENATEIKRAEIMVQGSQLTLVGAQGLQDHASCEMCDFSVTEDGLRIVGGGEDTNESFLIIHDTNPTVYAIQDPYNWYGSEIYMVPRQDYSVIRIQWGSDAEEISVHYESEHEIIEVAHEYGSPYDLYSIWYNDIEAPAGTALRIDSKDDEAQGSVYLVEYGTNQATNFNQFTARTQEALREYSSGLGNLPVASIKKVAEGLLAGTAVSLLSAQHQAIVVEEATYSYVFPIHTQDFSVAITYDAQGRKPYYHEITTNRLLDNAYNTTQLSKVFGDSVEVLKHGFTHQPVPGIAYSGAVTFRSLYGEELSVPLNYITNTMDSEAVTQGIVSNNTISILPPTGSFSDILIQYKNIPSFSVSITPCTVNETPDLSLYKGTGFENYFFSCYEENAQQKVIAPVGEQFEYRRAYRTPLQIPEEFADTQAFKVSFYDVKGEHHAHYLLKTNIGMWTKVDNGGVHVWGFGFATGSPLETGNIMVNALDGSYTKSGVMENGYAYIPIPKTDYATDWDNRWKKNTYIVSLESHGDEGFLLLGRGGADDIYVYIDGESRYVKLNSRLSAHEVMSDDQSSFNEYGSMNPLKIYGYTDRALYKIGDQVHVTGFVRDVLQEGSSLDYLAGKTVTVEIDAPSGGEKVTLPSLSLDEFGGFAGSYTIPEGVPLGEYFVHYKLDGEGNVGYSHIIKIQDYQKPTYFADMSMKNTDKTISLEITPEYYFGASLESYDVQVTWSVASTQACWYCRWWNEDDWYYNHTFDGFEARSGKEVLYGIDTPSVVIPLYEEDDDTATAFDRTLKVDLIIKDTRSDETQFFTKYIDFEPPVSLGMGGQPYEWLYQNDDHDSRDGFSLPVQLQSGSELVSSLSYEVYYYNYEQRFKKGVDAHVYYSNDQEYVRIDTGNIDIQQAKTSGGASIPTDFIADAGAYFIRVFAQDTEGKVVGEVQKKLSWYTFDQGGSDLLGAVPNNYSLLVNIPKKVFNEGMDIPIDISPYQKGARVVITVEKGPFILDSYLVQLDGSQLSIPVKSSYTPDVVVSVMQIQGIDDTPEERKEPRFYAGFSEVEISEDIHVLEIQSSTDKDTYRPGDEVSLSITTRDVAGNPVDARVSVSVIDQALANLYYEIKAPMPYFFSTVGTSVYTYTNMKLLYQSLKAFATGGTKGGDGGAGKAMIGVVRDDLKDIAFWDASIVTRGGTAEVTFTLPENLTTRMIDLVGYTKDTRLGTEQTQIVVSKPFVLEANPPLYVTLGDTLQVPVRATLVEVADSRITGGAYIENAFGERIELGSYEAGYDEKILVDLYMPSEWMDSPFITFGVYGSYGGYSDGIETVIPVRTDGLQARESMGTIASTGSVQLGGVTSLMQASTVSVGLLPTQFIDPAMSYLLHYNYGCAEQMMSVLLTVMTAKDLATAGGMTSKYIQGDTLLLEAGRIDSDAFVTSLVKKILARQMKGGYFVYWNEYADYSPEHYYALTAYIYGGLLHYGELYDAVGAGVSRGVLDEAIDSAAQYLWDYRGKNDQAFMYALLQKARNTGNLSQRERTYVDTIQANSIGYGPLIRYLLAVHTDDKEAMQKRRPLAKIPTNNATQRSQFSIFMNQTIATALKLEASGLDQGVTQEDRRNLLLSLLKERNKKGLWSYSTQTNIQVLQALGSVNELMGQADTLSCTVSMNQQEKTVQVDHQNPSKTVTMYGKGGDVDFGWECSSPAFIDLITTYVPQDITTIADATTNVSEMERVVSDANASIGSTVTIGGSFTTAQTGKELAVELFVPSDYKLLNVIRSQQDNHGYPFDVSDSGCYPDHWETRFDRLFLYYDTLPSITCDITIDALKAYEGSTTIMPFRVWEMYRGSINGRKVVHEK